MNNTEQQLQAILDKRIADGSFRTLPQKDHLIDFCSNDYLGLSRSALLWHNVLEELKKYRAHKKGATGSRLISGNSAYTESVEAQIAQFHHAHAALLFNSGFDANCGLFSAVPQKGDLIIYDEHIHASVHDGIKLSRAAAVSFRHNDLADLEEKLQLEARLKFISVESLYSMDGSFAPLEKIMLLCKKYNANLIVDEAHATGLYGERGTGLVCHFRLEQDVFARVHTFGKALGCNGAAVLGSSVLKQFLINYARSFVFTTALPFFNIAAIKCSYEILPHCHNKRKKISRLVDLFKQSIQVHEPMSLLPSDSPIQSIVIPGNEQAKYVAAQLEQHGFYAKAILYPTVSKGTERIRFCIHAFNTEAQILKLTKVINELSKAIAARHTLSTQ
jgi:8-amino-7-oxononanoate synthase